jgi:aldose 1-epimerase
MIKNAIKLNCGRWGAEICPSLGANIVRLTCGGADVLRPLENEDDLKINPYLYGAPILMPANRTFEGKFILEGREYHLPINEPQNNCNLHGSVLFEEFDLVEACEKSAVLRLVDKDCRSYPFPFALTVMYSLTENGLSADYEVENIGEGNMPLTFCLHTTFVEPEGFTCPIDMCQEKDEHHIPTGRYIALNEQEREYATSSPSKGLVISGYYRACGNEARIGDYKYSVSDNFDHWIFFNGRGESGLLCVEPQCGKVNGLNMENGHIVLAPSGKITFETRITK